LLEFDTISKIEDNPLVIGSDVLIGEGVIIMPSCKLISDGAVVGAGSIVTKNVEPFTIVAGNPAKFIKKRFSDKTIEKVLTSKWWELPLSDLLCSGYLSLVKKE